MLKSLGIMSSNIKARAFQLAWRYKVYQGVVLIDNVSCTSNIERSKRIFFNQHNSTHQEFSYVDINVKLDFFQNACYAILWYWKWFVRLHKKDLNNISVVCQIAIKRMRGRNSCNGNHECLQYDRLPVFKPFHARKFICYTHRVFTSKSPCLVILNITRDIFLFLE